MYNAQNNFIYVPMKTVTTISALRAPLKEMRQNGDSVALVPTMGNLHKGHLKLIEVARSLADRVVATIFINPIQFSKGEDYRGYPQTLEEDAQKLLMKKTDILFVPDTNEIFPNLNQPSTFIEVPELSHILCGEFRPGHFRGVSTIVCKLLNMVQPNIAVFGEKDYQQLVVIRRMVADLNIPITIHSVPTVRESDGLAMSSRNIYLSDQERRVAPLLYRTLTDVQDEMLKGNRAIASIESDQTIKLIDAGFSPDYFSIRCVDDLQSVHLGDSNLIVLAAAWLGKARLIDNLVFRIS